ncbi:MAG: hypothetical protein DMF56_05510 [Acidobacteria bacterium]|nr:MAG: hypothetical protein DMF56_05510 [Acidobacteriota bacterium]
MDPEFQHMLLTVLGVGSGIASVVTLVLFLLFRRFGGKSHGILIAVLTLFIAACCVALLLVSRE